MENDKLELGTFGTLELIKNSYQITNKFKTGLLRWILQHLVKKLGLSCTSYLLIRELQNITEQDSDKKQ